MFDRRAFLALALVALLIPAAQADKPKPVKPNRAWTGIQSKDARLKQAPRSGFITDAKAFEKLWKAWQPASEKVPTVDFKKEFVVVGTASASRSPPDDPLQGISASLDDKGNLTTRYIATLIGGPGFGFSFATFERKGVKSVNGKPLGK
jgi:hypothetical protein